MMISAFWKPTCQRWRTHTTGAARVWLPDFPQQSTSVSLANSLYADFCSCCPYGLSGRLPDYTQCLFGAPIKTDFKNPMKCVDIMLRYRAVACSPSRRSLSADACSSSSKGAASSAAAAAPAASGRAHFSHRWSAVSVRQQREDYAAALHAAYSLLDDSAAAELLPASSGSSGRSSTDRSTCSGGGGGEAAEVAITGPVLHDFQQRLGKCLPEGPRSTLGLVETQPGSAAPGRTQPDALGAASPVRPDGAISADRLEWGFWGSPMEPMPPLQEAAEDSGGSAADAEQQQELPVTAPGAVLRIKGGPAADEEAGTEQVRCPCWRVWCCAMHAELQSLPPLTAGQLDVFVHKLLWGGYCIRLRSW